MSRPITRRTFLEIALLAGLAGAALATTGCSAAQAAAMKPSEVCEKCAQVSDGGKLNVVVEGVMANGLSRVGNGGIPTVSIVKLFDTADGTGPSVEVRIANLTVEQASELVNGTTFKVSGTFIAAATNKREDGSVVLSECKLVEYTLPQA